ncbi:apolipoprotein N-acyltransferase [Syntrophus aciditrophicus]|uniref:Apolipoprotein N-acyltransferase n=1 Tax=Syntrophus aciditrophicus (strain SB) TaxID=56780 RepID=Q2LTK8_SYNAS|nr:apolipoprotein N-acyltransferase [Syntrophus aciditrophicus]ABC77418.1 apolipoprotein N-acyltransferase [Syntrophus aciditrophicus SB]
MQLSYLALHRKTIAVAALSSLLLFLSFPKYGTGLFAWIALIPFLYTLREKTVYQGAVIGFFVGMLFHVGLIYWIVYVIVVYGNLPYYAAIFLMLLLAAYLSIYFALFAAGLIHLKNKSIPFIISAPPLWIILEFVKSNLFTGFPWENLAYSQYLNHHVIQIADLAGGYGISFVIVLVNVIGYDLFFDRITKKKIALEIALGIALISSIYSYGVLRGMQIDMAVAKAPSIPVTLVQGNIDQSLKWNDHYQKETIDIYQKLSLAPPEKTSPGMIIWPETAVPFYFQNVDDLHRRIVSLAVQTENWILFGSPSYAAEEGKLSFLNTAFLLSPHGNMVAQYNKVHLVPYGEYVPLRRFFPFIGKMAAGVGDFQAGEGFIPIKAGEWKIGVLICYEGILSEAGRIYKNEGAGLLVNITNDAWFGRTSAPYQHLSMTVFRAVENRLFLARAANTGISAIIDPTGKILMKSSIFERTAIQGHIKYLNLPTLYAKYGDIFVYVCFILLISIYLMSEKRRITK